MAVGIFFSVGCVLCYLDFVGCGTKDKCISVGGWGGKSAFTHPHTFISGTVLMWIINHLGLRRHPLFFFLSPDQSSRSH